MWGGPQVRSRASSPGLSINQEVAEADLGVGLRTRGPPYENSATLSSELPRGAFGQSVFNYVPRQFGGGRNPHLLQ